MMVATGRWDSELAWRLPLYIQMVPAALNFLLVFLCPESYVSTYAEALWCTDSLPQASLALQRRKG